MKKTYALNELDCANCALKMEDAIRKIDGVMGVQVNFITQKLTLEAADDRFEEILKETVRICRRVEPDCRIMR